MNESRKTEIETLGAVYPEIFITLENAKHSPHVCGRSLYWKSTKRLFLAELEKLGLTYSALTSWLDGMDMVRPPRIGAKGRLDLLAFLERQTPEFRANL